MNQSMSEKNSFYESGVKLLAQKFIKEFGDPDGELRKLNEGLERTFEYWAGRIINKDEVQMRDDVWRLIIKRIMTKSG